MTDGLPSGWRWLLPEQLAADEAHALGIGPFGSDLKVSDYAESGVPLVFVRNIRSELFGGPLDRFVSHEKAARLKAHAVRAGDLLITKMGEPPGDVCIYPPDRPDAIMTADCVRLRPRRDLGPTRYLMYALRSPAVQEQILDRTTGVAQRKISLERFRSVRVPIAPRTQQDHIVEAMDLEFSRIDAGISSLSAAAAKLKAYRASVLKSACEGRLVPTEAELARREGRDYEPADRLPARILDERRTRSGPDVLAKARAPKAAKAAAAPAVAVAAGRPSPPEGWQIVRLDEIADVQLGQQRAPVHAAADVTMPYVRAANITWRGLDLSDVNRMGFPNPARYRLEVGDVLLAEASGSASEVGKPAIWRGEIADCCYQKTLLRVRSRASEILPEWLHLQFLADAMLGRFAAMAPGVGILHLTAERMLGWPMLVAPVDEQRRVVAEVDRLMSFADDVERAIVAQLARAKTLRRAVLRDAFEGRLQ